MPITASSLRNRLLLVAIPALFSHALSGAGRGQGAVALNDNTPVYASATGDKIEYTLKFGDPVGATGGMTHEFYFTEKEGRLHIQYFANSKQRGTQRSAWIKTSAVATFNYECCFEKDEPGGNCKPFDTGFTVTWNPCFREAHEKKLAELTAARKTSATTSPGGPMSSSSSLAAASERPFSNEDVIALCKVDLGDDLVIQKVQQAPKEQLDVSTEALVTLKNAGVRKPVLDAILKRVAQRK